MDLLMVADTLNYQCLMHVALTNLLLIWILNRLEMKAQRIENADVWLLYLTDEMR